MLADAKVRDICAENKRVMAGNLMNGDYKSHIKAHIKNHIMLKI